MFHRITQPSRNHTALTTLTSLTHLAKPTLSNHKIQLNPFTLATSPSTPEEQRTRSTTILTVRKNDQVVCIGDGQISMGPTIVKTNANKVRRLGMDGDVVAGFAGAAADALTLMELLEQRLEEYPGQLLRACTSLVRTWRTERSFRHLEAIIVVSDLEHSFTLTGNGDLIATDDVIGIGSGGNYAMAAARALYDQDLSALEIAERSMKIASEICVYTSDKFVVEMLPEAEEVEEEE